MRLEKTLAMLAVLTRLSATAMTVENLRCEYAESPVGIDTTTPRLQWTLASGTRGDRQTAYQIVVASSPMELDSGTNLLWDTGKTASAEIQATYAGQPLRSSQRCYWKIRAWDRNDTPSPWSAHALWQTALLAPPDWTAHWIGPRETCAPTWSNVTVAADVTLQEEAVGLVFRAQDADNFYMWQLNCVLGPELMLRPHVCKDGKWSMLPTVPLRAFVAAADDHKTHRVVIETFGAVIRTRIDGRLVDERTDTTFASGTVGFRADSKERALIDNLTVTDPAGGVLLNETFDRAETAFPNAHTADGRLVLNGATLLHRQPLPKSCPRLRKAFTLDKSVRRATVSVCGLGFYELYLNGRKAGDRVLAPPNTPYGQRLLFDTLDVTPFVQPGANAIGIWLAPGYSDDYSRWGWKWEVPKRAIAQLDVVYQDGTTTRIATDASWLYGPSPLTFASLYDGEVFDAALEDPLWSAASFASTGWGPVRVWTPTGARLLPDTMPPVRVVQVIRPVAISEPQPGVFVADMGQNFAGWVRLRARGPRGTRVVLRHSELLGPDGLLDPWTNRRAKATDMFILRGEGLETYEPRFTYHGFCFVEITGYPGRPTADDVVGCAVGSDVKPTGTFRSSDTTLNRLGNNCRWSMRSNLMGIPTDCCMRDERTPCQMDSLAYEESAMYHFDMARYYAKWLDDIDGGRGNPDWNGDQVFLPWRLYWFYNDRRTLETRYANMRAYVEHLCAKTPGLLYADGFGDWCPPNDGTWAGYHGDVTEVNTCLYAELTRIVAETATLLGKADDAVRFRRLADDIAHAFHVKRFDATKAVYGDGSQTTAILPLAFNLVPSDQRSRVFDSLLATIRDTNHSRLDTGIFGTRYLADVLCDGGAPTLALHLLTQPEYPGFGFQIANGATTLWEQWTIKGGMNSHNHAMFAESTLSTVAGTVFVRWERIGDGLSLCVRIPVNATARVSVPTADAASVTEGGSPVSAKSDLQPIGFDGQFAVYRIGSGEYRFATTKRPAFNQ